ncbi:hypothetical protein H0N96_02135 [Candidatus Micrarchaeota archaeon]|nr:hypothetical protein [Candidatus Micrarchaeota archaeon]
MVFAIDFSLFTQVFQILSVVLTPIVIIYAIVAYKGEYESRALPSVIAVALLLGFSTLAGVWGALGGSSIALAIQALLVLASIAILFLILRSYIHSEIELSQNGDLKPRAVLRAERAKVKPRKRGR